VHWQMSTHGAHEALTAAHKQIYSEELETDNGQGLIRAGCWLSFGCKISIAHLNRRIDLLPQFKAVCCGRLRELEALFAVATTPSHPKWAAKKEGRRISQPHSSRNLPSL